MLTNEQIKTAVECYNFYRQFYNHEEALAEAQWDMVGIWKAAKENDYSFLLNDEPAVLDGAPEA